MHKRWLREDSWDKPKNDWCWGRGFSMVTSKQRSVAFSNKVVDTRLPQPAGCGDKYDGSDLSYRLLCCVRNDGASNGEGLHRPWCNKILGTRPRMTGGRGANQLGRSMIEMLGVLAIIGVLSVGGIAGYSKAMEKWKINKMAEEYSYLIHGLLGHLTEFQNLPVRTGLVDTSFALGIIPDTWKKNASLNVTDTFGNLIKPYVRDNRLVIDFYLGGISTNSDNARVSQGFSKRTCETLMRDVAAPLHYSVSVVWIFLSGNSTAPSKYFYGDSRCSQGLPCLSEITLSDIHEACGLCDGKRQCSITLEF